MERVNSIIKNSIFLECIETIKKHEEDRVFCGHGMGHLLDVARIAYIIALEEKLPLSKDMIYGAALLHDIGRHVQYENKTPHSEASAAIAPDILKEADYRNEEIEQILSAIRAHSKKGAEHGSLNDVLYRADKLSRGCYFCLQEENCNWDENKKNRGLTI